MNTPADHGSTSDRLTPRVGFVPADHAQLYFREIGADQPIIVIHGGPDFDHQYLLPELDRLADVSRLIYYDQRGRGRSAEGVRPEDVTIGSEIEDIERLRQHFQLESLAVLGHSWGGLVAMEYATRHPERVSHLILMNTAPVSRDDWLRLRRNFRRVRTPADLEMLRAITTSSRYQTGDLETDAEYYRIHFKPAVCLAGHLELIVGRLRQNFTAEGVCTARDIEGRLYDQTWSSAGYDLIPKLRELRMPTLLLHGHDDFIPVALAARIAQAMPSANLRVLQGCGHFAYLEAPDRVHEHIATLLGRG